MTLSRKFFCRIKLLLHIVIDVTFCKVLTITKVKGDSRNQTKKEKVKNKSEKGFMTGINKLSD